MNMPQQSWGTFMFSVLSPAESPAVAPGNFPTYPPSTPSRGKGGGEGFLSATWFIGQLKLALLTESESPLNILPGVLSHPQIQKDVFGEGFAL